MAQQKRKRFTDKKPFSLTHNEIQTAAIHLTERGQMLYKLASVLSAGFIPYPFIHSSYQST